MISQDVVTILQYLLPGFLASWVFYGLSGHERSNQFERIVQALIFTVPVQAVVELLMFLVPMMTTHLTYGHLQGGRDIIAAASAFVVGFIFAVLANKDWLHRFLRFCRLTNQTSYPSEWFGVLSKEASYAVLHLKDGRRLYGWMTEWPQSPDRGHIYMERAEWLDPEANITTTRPTDGSDDNEAELSTLEKDGVSGILMPVTYVQWVELMASGGK